MVTRRKEEHFRLRPAPGAVVRATTHRSESLGVSGVHCDNAPWHSLYGGYAMGWVRMKHARGHQALMPACTRARCMQHTSTNGSSRVMPVSVRGWRRFSAWKSRDRPAEHHAGPLVMHDSASQCTRRRSGKKGSPASRKHDSCITFSAANLFSCRPSSCLLSMA